MQLSIGFYPIYILDSLKREEGHQTTTRQANQGKPAFME